ncbi:Hsp70 family protein, partial [Streptomyces sp. NPDC054933]
YQTEKFLKDNEEKVPGEVKTEVEAAIAELKERLKGEDVAAIREGSEKLATTSQKLGQAMYAAAGEGAGAAASGDTGASGAAGAKPEDEVVDAEIVDDEKPQGGTG